MSWPFEPPPWWMFTAEEDESIEDALTRMRAPPPDAYRLKALIEQGILGRSKLFVVARALTCFFQRISNALLTV